MELDFQRYVIVIWKLNIHVPINTLCIQYFGLFSYGILAAIASIIVIKSKKHIPYKNLLTSCRF